MLIFINVSPFLFSSVPITGIYVYLDIEWKLDFCYQVCRACCTIWSHFSIDELVIKLLWFDTFDLVGRRDCLPPGFTSLGKLAAGCSLSDAGLIATF